MKLRQTRLHPRPNPGIEAFVEHCRRLVHGGDAAHEHERLFSGLERTGESGGGRIELRMRQRVSKHLAIGAHDLSERLGVDAVALPVAQAAALLLAVERRFVLVPAACGLDRLQEALERGQHADLEMVVESLGLQHPGHFLLHQRHDQALPGIHDLDRFVMVLEPAASPLAPVHVLGVQPARDVEPRDTANEEALGDPSLLVLGDLGICEGRDTDAGFAVSALQYGVTEAEDRELALDGGIVVLEWGGREQQHALGFLRVPRLSEGIAIGMAERESHDPVARAAIGAESMLQVMGLVENDQIGLWNRAVQGRRKGVAKALRGAIRHMAAFEPAPGVQLSRSVRKRPRSRTVNPRVEFVCVVRFVTTCRPNAVQMG